MLLTHSLTGEHPAGDLMVNATAEFGTSDPDIQQALNSFYDDYLTLTASVILKGQANQPIITSQSSMQLAQNLLEARIGLQIRLRQGQQSDIEQRKQAWLDFLTK